jgi:uncharacterized repeat protein (TIGR04138 family)
MDKAVKKQSPPKAVAEQEFPPAAFEFVQRGLAYTVTHVHPDYQTLDQDSRHVTGQQLALGLKAYAIKCYGHLAKAVLAHWGVHTTRDFGRVVYAMIDQGIMHKTPTDSLDDFNDVFDFDSAFSPPKRPRPPAQVVFDLNVRK